MSSWSMSLSYCCFRSYVYFLFFFYTQTAPTQIYTLSLHDALPISGFFGCFTQFQAGTGFDGASASRVGSTGCVTSGRRKLQDRKSTRLNSSHVAISYAVFCLKKKKK